MAEQSGPYTIRPEMTGSDCWVVTGPGVNTHGMAKWVAERDRDRLNRAFAAGVASAAPQGGERAGDRPWVRLEAWPRRNEAEKYVDGWVVTGHYAEGCANVAPDLTEVEARALADAYNAHANPAAVGAVIEAANNAVPMMQMAWKQYGVGGMFECMDALRTALARLGPDTKGTPDDTR